MSWVPEVKLYRLCWILLPPAVLILNGSREKSRGRENTNINIFFLVHCWWQSLYNKERLIYHMKEKVDFEFWVSALTGGGRSRATVFTMCFFWIIHCLQFVVSAVAKEIIKVSKASYRMTLTCIWIFRTMSPCSSLITWGDQKTKTTAFFAFRDWPLSTFVHATGATQVRFPLKLMYM